MSDKYVKPTRVQMDYLVRSVSKNVTLSKGTRPECIAFWQKLCRRLNSIGPPVRDILKWKRSWADYKYKSSRRNHTSRITLPLADGDAGGDPVEDDDDPVEDDDDEEDTTEATQWWEGDRSEDYRAYLEREEKNLTTPMPNVQRESAAITLTAAEYLEIDDDEITEIKIEPFCDPLDAFDAVESLSVPNRRAPQNTDNIIIPPSKQRLIEKKIDPKIKSRVDSVQGQLMKKLAKNTLKRERNELLRHQNALLQKMHSGTESHRKAILAQNNELIDLKRQKLAFIMRQEGGKQ